MRKGIWGFALVAIMLLMASCSSKSEYANAIPKDAAMVMSFDFKTMAEKRHTVAVSVHGTDAVCIAVVVTCFQITEIGRQIVGQTIYTGLLVQNGHDLVDVLALFVSDELHDGRIDITGTGSHDKTL